MIYSVKIPFDKQVIYADIKAAKMILYDKGKMYNENPYMLCMGAYHAGQAIEKTLKYILALVNPIALQENKNIHNISELILSVERGAEGFINEHPDLVQNAANLSKLNSLRYGISHISRKDALKIYHFANDLVNEMIRSLEFDINFTPRNDIFFIDSTNKEKKMNKTPVNTNQIEKEETTGKEENQNIEKKRYLKNNNVGNWNKKPQRTVSTEEAESNTNKNYRSASNNSGKGENITRAVLAKNKATHSIDER